VVNHRHWASEHNTKTAEFIIVYNNQCSGSEPLDHGIPGGRRFIAKWPRSYSKDSKNLCNFVASRAVPASAWFRLLSIIIIIIIISAAKQFEP
jgi:hypothetical protein